MIKKPEKKSILSECAYQGGGIPKNWIKERTDFIDGFNKACDEWETYHNEVIANMGNCGGGWTYDAIRDCFTNQMGDIR